MTALHVLGDTDTVRLFALAGVPGTVVEPGTDSAALLDTLLAPAVAAARTLGVVLLVTQAVAAMAREHIDALVANSGGSVVLEIPGIGEALGTDPLHRLMARALRSGT